MGTWIEHVKKVHAAGSTSFKESLKRASASWKKAKGKSAKAAAPAAAAAPKKKRRRRKKKAEPEEEDQEVEEEKEAPKKKKKRRRKPGPKISAQAFKSVDSRNLS